LSGLIDVNRTVWRSAAIVLSRELATTAALLVSVSLVVFVILYLAPGDPFAALLGGRTLAGAERDAAYAALGIPRTWYGQYLAWIGNVLQGDFGLSMRSGQPVARELLSSGARTLFLTLGSLLVTLAVAIPIATYSAVHPESRRGQVATLAVYIVSALPTFWLGYIVIYIFTHQLGMFPILSGTGEAQQHSWLYALLPVLLLGLGNGALSEVVRHLREEISRVLSEEYIRTARAKGAAVWRHAYKEALLLPVAEIIAAKMPFVLGGAIIVEQVFNWPGLGRVAWQAAQDRDYPVIMAVTLLAAVMVRLGSLLHRSVYVAVNPRASAE
jgi:peptide/nickel transport system permease protein